MKNKEDLCYFSGITLYAVLIFVCLLAGNPDAFYVDDNIMQWGPVIRQGFDQIFAGEGIPYWNFYQYKGLDIFSSGYYGFLNPFMYLSYCLSRFVFSYQLETLTIYEFLMYWLGLQLMDRILRKDMHFRNDTVLLSLAAYSVSIIFFSHAFYYFTFNNYFFIPLLIWMTLHIRSSRTEWAVPGVLLSFSLLLGHVQYTCYYIMIYCILQVVFTAQQKKWQTLLPVFSNIGIFVLLSSGLLFLSLKASKNRTEIMTSFSINEFFLDAVPMISVMKPINGMFLLEKLSDRRKLEQYVGAGIFPHLILFPLLKSFCSFLYLWMISKDEKIFQGNMLRYQLKLENGFMIAIYFIAIRLLLYQLLPFHVLTDWLIILILLIIAIFFGVISIKKEQYLFRMKNILPIGIYLLAAVFILYFPFWIYLAVVIFYIYYCRKKEISLQDGCLHAFGFAAFFFVLFGTGKENIIALLLNMIPVMNHFRYLYKCAFIYIPLLIVCGAAVLDKLTEGRKVVSMTSAVCSVVAFVNIVYMIHSGIHPYINNQYFDYLSYRKTEQEVTERLEELELDRNYRFLMLYDGYNSSTKDTEPIKIPFYLLLDVDAEAELQQTQNTQDSNSIEYSSKICTYAFTKNLSTSYGLFSLCGYDNIFSKKSFDQNSMLMENSFLEGMMCNMSLMANRFQNYLNPETKERLELFQLQLVENSIRYLLFPEGDTELVKEIETVIEACDQLEVVRLVPWLHGMQLMELSGTKPICSANDLEELPLKSRMNQLQFRTNFQSPQKITISMTYDPHYALISTDASGSSADIAISETVSGYLSAEIPAGDYQLTLEYHNRYMDISVWLACVTLFLTLLALILIPKNINDRVK